VVHEVERVVKGVRVREDVLRRARSMSVARGCQQACREGGAAPASAPKARAGGRAGARRVQEVKQRVELVQVVLQRRAGQQQHVLPAAPRARAP